VGWVSEEGSFVMLFWKQSVRHCRGGAASNNLESYGGRGPRVYKQICWNIGVEKGWLGWVGLGCYCVGQGRVLLLGCDVMVVEDDFIVVRAAHYQHPNLVSVFPLIRLAEHVLEHH